MIFETNGSLLILQIAFHKEKYHHFKFHTPFLLKASSTRQNRVLAIVYIYFLWAKHFPWDL